MDLQNVCVFFKDKHPHTEKMFKRMQLVFLQAVRAERLSDSYTTETLRYSSRDKESACTSVSKLSQIFAVSLLSPCLIDCKKNVFKKKKKAKSLNVKMNYRADSWA